MSMSGKNGNATMTYKRIVPATSTAFSPTNWPNVSAGSMSAAEPVPASTPAEPVSGCQKKKTSEPTEPRPAHNANMMPEMMCSVLSRSGTISAMMTPEMP